jgi:hypothetical protein
VSVLRALIAALLGAALLGRALLAEPESFAVTGPALLLAFLVSGGALALDVLDRRWSGVAADVLVFPAALAANVRVTGAVGVVVAALLAQGLPRGLAWWRRRPDARGEPGRTAQPPGARP